MSLILNGTTGISDVDGTAAAPALTGTDSNTGIFFPAADTIAFSEGGAEAMRIDSSGFVGIGTSSPTRALTVVGTWTNTGDYLMDSNAPQFAWSSGDLRLKYGGLGGTEAMRIDSSGNLLVGTTTSNGLITSIQASTSAYSGYFTSNYTATNNASINFWGRSGGAVAAAVRYKDTGTSMEFYSPTGHTVAYTTSSDYRLKEDVQPMTGALAKVAALKPCTYKWKVDGSDGEGFIAHELQAVVPDCVSGEKDAVAEEQYEVTPATKDEEGNTITEAVMGTRTVPAYQGIDTSFLVATLTAAIQELNAKFEEYKAAHP